MKILHDWDNPYLPWYKYHVTVRDLQKHALTLAKLDILTGVTPVFGIRKNIYNHHPLIGKKLSLLGCKVHNHIHIGEPPDPDRKRIWDPPLNQPQHTWHYDKNWVQGKYITLNAGEMPIWHVDRPYYLWDYIDFLYKSLIGGMYD